MKLRSNPFRKGSLAMLVAGLSLSGPAMASLIPIGSVPLTGTGIGAVNSVVTFQNNGTEVGAVGVQANGSMGTGAAFAYGIPGFPSPGGATHETTGAGNNIYAASSLGLTPGGALSFSNLVLLFNGNEGGNVNTQGIVLTDLALNLYSPTGSLLGTFTTVAPYTVDAFEGVGSAGFGFQLDDTQAAQANALLADSPELIIGAAARATGANAGFETIFVSTLPGTVTPGVPDSGATVALLGLALVGLAGCRRWLRL